MEQEQTYEPTDIFHWANQTDAIKNKFEIELFLFSKNYTVYATNYAEKLGVQLKALFVNELINEVITGAAMGLKVRDFEAAEAEDNVLSRTQIANVQHAQEVYEQITIGRDTLEFFSESEHEFKRIKGVVAQCRYGDSEPFFVVKLLPQTQVLSGATAWQFHEGQFQPFQAEAGLRLTPDNQVLIVGADIFAFSESKFERLFGYDAKKHAIAEEKVKAIESTYRLSLPDELTLDSLVKEKKVLVNKLQKLDTDNLVPTDLILEQAAAMDIEMMQDESGAIILMDEKNARTFITLINDDYITSPMTGYRYEVRSKRRIDEEPADAVANS